MIKKNRSECKYVYISTHHVDSTDAPRVRTVYNGGTNTKRQEVLNIAINNKKINTFQERSSEFKATIDLTKISASS
jgi:hypothetical protein